MNIVDKVDAVIACLIAKSATEKAAALANLEVIASIECDPISIEDAVCIALREIGIPSHQGGYQYLQYAIKKVCTVPSYESDGLRHIYDAIAEKFDTTCTRASRKIRYAIEMAWLRNDPDVLYRYFGNTVDPTRGRPTNLEFIATMAAYCKKMYIEPQNKHITG